MAGKFTGTATNLLKLMYQAVAWANLGDNAATSPFTNVYWGLLSGLPAASGDQTTNELAYTGYARQAVARTSGGHAVASGVANPVANVVFPVSTSGTPTATHFNTGDAASGAGHGWHFGPVTPTIVVSTVVPQTLTNGSTITES